MKLIDLTQTWSVQTPTWPYFPSNSVRNFHSHHRDGVYSTIIETNMHSGTHVDAPQHNNPTGWYMHQVPLESLFGPTVIVDVSHMVDDYTILTKEMFQEAEKKAPPIQKGDSVIVYYNWHRFNWEGKNADEVRYFCKCPGPSLDLTDYLISKDIRWVGSDAPSFEHPFWTAIREYRPDLVREMETKFGKSIEEMLPSKYFLQAHRRMLDKNMMHVDNIGGDIDKVVNQRLTVGAFPWKFHRGDASICRLVAFVED